MDGIFVTENTAKSRSFRREDYNNRRVFLRSYPLHWGSDDEGSEEQTVRMINKNAKKKPSKKSSQVEDEKTEEEPSFRSYRKKDQKIPIKNIVLSAYQWGEGKVIILRRFKHKVAVYVVACIPARKLPTGLISA